MDENHCHTEPIAMRTSNSCPPRICPSRSPTPPSNRKRHNSLPPPPPPPPPPPIAGEQNKNALSMTRGDGSKSPMEIDETITPPPPQLVMNIGGNNSRSNSNGSTDLFDMRSAPIHNSNSNNSSSNSSSSNSRRANSLETLKRSSPSSTEATAATSTSSSPSQSTSTHRRFPCKARCVPENHTAETAYFDIPPNAKHGLLLTCSDPACARSGRRFRYCAVCDVPVAKRNFLRRHSHGLIADNHSYEDDTANNNATTTSGSGDETKVVVLAMPFRAKKIAKTNTNSPRMCSFVSNNSSNSNNNALAARNDESTRTRPTIQRGRDSRSFNSIIESPVSNTKLRDLGQGPSSWGHPGQAYAVASSSSSSPNNANHAPRVPHLNDLPPLPNIPFRSHIRDDGSWNSRAEQQQRSDIRLFGSRSGSGSGSGGGDIRTVFEPPPKSPTHSARYARREMLSTTTKFASGTWGTSSSSRPLRVMSDSQQHHHYARNHLTSTPRNKAEVEILNPREKEWLQLLRSRPPTDDTEHLRLWVQEVLRTSEPALVDSVSPLRSPQMLPVDAPMDDPQQQHHHRHHHLPLHPSHHDDDDDDDRNIVPLPLSSSNSSAPPSPILADYHHHTYNNNNHHRIHVDSSSIQPSDDNNSSSNNEATISLSPVGNSSRFSSRDVSPIGVLHRNGNSGNIIATKLPPGDLQASFASAFEGTSSNNHRRHHHNHHRRHDSNTALQMPLLEICKKE